MIQNYINHIVFVVDQSGSMGHLSQTVVQVFDQQVAYLAQRSQELKQETRASVYLFSDQSNIRCLLYDMDVMRLPSLQGHYRADGQTALIDATLKSIQDLKQTPELYGDHAFLVYVLTDGEENDSRNRANTLVKTLSTLRENWTVAVLVPDSRGVFEAKKFGFPPDNISVWDATTSRGLEQASSTIQEATERYLVARSAGVRGTKTLFHVDMTVAPGVVKRSLQELNPRDYQLLPVHRESVIKEFVEAWTKQPYRTGSAYYQLMKAETVQAHKQVCIQEKRTGKVYTGREARTMLGLPNHEIRVSPGDFGEYDIYVQSTSQNRKLIGGTKLLVMG